MIRRMKDEVLKDINKGVSSQELIEAAKKVKEAKILLSVTGIAGIGGKEKSEIHATQTHCRRSFYQQEIKIGCLGSTTAQAVKDALVKNYGIAADRLNIEAGGGVDKFGQPILNRVVLVKSAN